MSRLKLLLLSLLLSAAPLLAATESTAGIPGGTSDPPCSTGDYFIWRNTTDGVIRKCENGVSIYVGLDNGQANSTNNGPVGSTYDPDRAPTSGTYGPCTDEFKNGVSTGTWSWQNQSSTTSTLDLDYLRLTDVNDTGTHAYYCVPDNSADWTFTAKVNVFGAQATANAGLVFIDGGTAASPTTVVGWILRRDNAATATGSLLVGTKAAWTTTTWTTVGTAGTISNRFYADGTFTYCLQARYVVATKIMTYAIAADCRNWSGNDGQTSTRTFTNHPDVVGIGIESTTTGIQTASVVIQWMRMRTDSAGTSGEYLVGK